MKYYFLIFSLIVWGLIMNINAFAGVNRPIILESRGTPQLDFENHTGKSKSYFTDGTTFKNAIASPFHKSIGSPKKLKSEFWDIVLLVLFILGEILLSALIIVLIIALGFAGLNQLIGIILLYPLYLLIVRFFYFFSSIPLWIWILLAYVIGYTIYYFVYEY